MKHYQYVFFQVIWKQGCYEMVLFDDDVNIADALVTFVASDEAGTGSSETPCGTEVADAEPNETEVQTEIKIVEEHLAEETSTETEMKELNTTEMDYATAQVLGVSFNSIDTPPDSDDTKDLSFSDEKNIQEVLKSNLNATVVLEKVDLSSFEQNTNLDSSEVEVGVIDNGTDIKSDREEVPNTNSTADVSQSESHNVDLPCPVQEVNIENATDVKCQTDNVESPTIENIVENKDVKDNSTDIKSDSVREDAPNTDSSADVDLSESPDVDLPCPVQEVNKENPTDVNCTTDNVESPTIDNIVENKEVIDNASDVQTTHSTAKMDIDQIESRDAALVCPVPKYNLDTTIGNKCDSIESPAIDRTVSDKEVAADDIKCYPIREDVPTTDSTAKNNVEPTESPNAGLPCPVQEDTDTTDIKSTFIREDIPDTDTTEDIDQSKSPDVGLPCPVQDIENATDVTCDTDSVEAPTIDSIVENNFIVPDLKLQVESVQVKIEPAKICQEDTVEGYLEGDAADAAELSCDDIFKSPSSADTVAVSGEVSPLSDDSYASLPKVETPEFEKKDLVVNGASKVAQPVEVKKMLATDKIVPGSINRGIEFLDDATN